MKLLTKDILRYLENVAELSQCGMGHHISVQFLASSLIYHIILGMLFSYW